MNRIDQLLRDKPHNVLSIYFTAGFPKREDTLPVLRALQSAGADLVEIGMPYSDPVADGPTIQASNQVAIENGMTIKTLFSQLAGIREQVQIPIILMGYLNPILQYGMEQFCRDCEACGIDGLIIPDLPLHEYRALYKELFEKHQLHNIFLITPQTPHERILEIDRQSGGFIYMVSSASITGARGDIQSEQVAYFQRINDMNLTNPRLIGFGISNWETFDKACQFANGAIIGSAFIQLIEQSSDLEKDISDYIESVKGND